MSNFSLILKNCNLVNEDSIVPVDIGIKGDRIEKIASQISSDSNKTIDLEGNLKQGYVSIGSVTKIDPLINSYKDVRVELSSTGSVEGEINSEDYLIVNNSANIKGVIEYASLQVSYGARIQGTLRHRGSVQSYSPVSTDEVKEDETNESHEGDQ